MKESNNPSKEDTRKLIFNNMIPFLNKHGIETCGDFAFDPKSPGAVSPLEETPWIQFSWINVRNQDKFHRAHQFQFVMKFLNHYESKLSFNKNINSIKTNINDFLHEMDSKKDVADIEIKNWLDGITNQFKTNYDSEIQYKINLMYFATFLNEILQDEKTIDKQSNVNEYNINLIMSELILESAPRDFCDVKLSVNRKDIVYPNSQKCEDYINMIKFISYLYHKFPLNDEDNLELIKTIIKINHKYPLTEQIKVKLIKDIFLKLLDYKVLDKKVEDVKYDINISDILDYTHEEIEDDINIYQDIAALHRKAFELKVDTNNVIQFLQNLHDTDYSGDRIELTKGLEKLSQLLLKDQQSSNQEYNDFLRLEYLMCLTQYGRVMLFNTIDTQKLFPQKDLYKILLSVIEKNLDLDKKLFSCTTEGTAKQIMKKYVYDKFPPKIFKEFLDDIVVTFILCLKTKGFFVLNKYLMKIITNDAFDYEKTMYPERFITKTETDEKDLNGEVIVPTEVDS